MPGRSLVNQRLRRGGKPLVVLAALFDFAQPPRPPMLLAVHPRTSLAR